MIRKPIKLGHAAMLLASGLAALLGLALFIFFLWSERDLGKAVAVAGAMAFVSAFLMPEP